MPKLGPLKQFCGENCNSREKVKLSFGENRNFVALRLLDIFEFKVCKTRYVCVHAGRWEERSFPKYGSHEPNLMV